MYEIKITTPQKTLNFLAEDPKKFRTALVEGFRMAVYFGEAQIKKSFGKPGKPKVGKDGRLRASISTNIKIGETYLKGIFGSGLRPDTEAVVYAAIQETGGTIRAKRDRSSYVRTGNVTRAKRGYLTFQVDGHWVKVKQVKLPARPYLEPGVEDNLAEFEKIITDTIQKRMI